MPTWLPSVPYSVPSSGYWSPVTSTLNWCEEDYYASHYCAELINTFTNLWFVWLGFKGIENSIRNGHDRIFLLGFVAYTIIGLNSFLFHATLKYSAQLGDELAMIYATCILFYSYYAFGLSTMAKRLLAVAIVALAVFITGYYHYLQDPRFHQSAFAILTASIVFRSIYVMETTLRPSRRDASKLDKTVGRAERERRDRRDALQLKTLYQLTGTGVGLVLFAFFIWNLDNNFCSHWRRWRRELGLPWGVLLEGHGWWHYFTGTAGYINIVRSIWIRYALRGKQDEVELIWPTLFSIPSVERKDKGSRPKSGKAE